MKRSTHKKILFIALAAAVTATAAHAEDSYTLYGKARMSVDSTDDGSNTVTRVSSNSSRLGFKGAEDIGNGLKALFQMETLVNMDDASTTLFSTGRNTYVGIAGGFGTAVLGNTDNPYKLATSRLDIWSDSMGDFNTIIGNVSGATTPFNEREPNSINYWSPKMNGLQFMAAYRPDETGGVNRDRYSLNALYENGPFYGSVAYEKHNLDNVSGASGNDTKGLTFGLGYTFNEDKTKLGLIYESLSEDNVASVIDRNAWYLALSHKMASNTVKIAYARAGDNDVASNTGANWYVVGLDHALSKRTALYALYATTDNDTGARYGLGTGGSSGAVVPTAGLDPSTFSIGINHDF
ncbi:MAG: porin [Gammaproteobacteria bacterium]|nr:porin [Gammaproteobacteria bacterium]